MGLAKDSLSLAVEFGTSIFPDAGGQIVELA